MARVGLGAAAGLVALLVLVAVALIAVTVIRNARGWRDSSPAGPSRHDRKRRASARWVSFQDCDPATGEWSGGIRLVARDGTELDRVGMYRLPSDASVSDRLDADAEAVVRAMNANGSRESS